jgi:hypothetical protein
MPSAFLFPRVLDHVGKHVAHVIIRRLVKDLFAPPLGAHEPGGLEQTEMVACQ